MFWSYKTFQLLHTSTQLYKIISSNNSPNFPLILLVITVIAQFFNTHRHIKEDNQTIFPYFDSIKNLYRKLEFFNLNPKNFSIDFL